MSRPKLLATNKRLNTAYVLKESFGQLWDYRSDVEHGCSLTAGNSACAGKRQLRKGLKTTVPLQHVRHLLWNQVPFYQEDRFFAPDIEIARQLLQ